MKVYISPSNQPRNMCRLGHSEKVHCEQLAALMLPHLRKLGIEGKVGTAVGLTNRVNEAKAWGADLYLPLHTNAYNGNVRGTRFGYNPGRSDSRAACETFVKRWRELYPGVVKVAQYTFYEAREPKVPSVYVELVFHDSLEDAQWLHSNMSAAAQKLAECCADVLGKKVSSDVRIKLTREENAVFHKVKVGDVISLTMEQYLLGVVPAEIGNPPLEAAKAQAIAARTYAYSRVKNGATIDDTTTYQAYRAPRSTSTAYASAHRGVRETSGQMLYYDGAPIQTAVYSASNGGQMVSAQERWGGERPYLVSGPDPWTQASGAALWGHGVGMSQAGAKYAAEHGKGYLDILAFYYPGTKVLPERAEPPKPEPKPQPKPEPKPVMPDKYLHTALVTTRLATGVNLWRTIGKRGTNGLAPKGAVIYVLEEVSALWVKAWYKGRTGYVDRQYLSEPPRADALYKARVATVYPLSLGLWREPRKVVRLMRIANGREIDVLKEVNATWAQVRVGKAVGYVDRKYLREVS